MVINGDGFSPGDLTIQVGEAVTWRNLTNTAETRNVLLHKKPPNKQNVADGAP